MIINPFAFGVAGATDPDFASVALLLHFDGTNGSTTITDSSSHGHTVTCNGLFARLTTTSPKYGTACLDQGQVFSDRLSLPNHASFDLAANDFCIEAWINLTALDASDGGAVLGRWGIGPSTNVDWIFYIDPSRQLGFYANGSAVIAPASGTAIPNDSAFHHVAITRSGSTFRIFIDGSVAASATASPTIAYSSGQDIRSSGWNSPTARAQSKLDEVRVTNGVPRYTSGFTPSGPFPDS